MAGVITTHTVRLWAQDLIAECERLSAERKYPTGRIMDIAAIAYRMEAMAHKADGENE